MKISLVLLGGELSKISDFVRSTHRYLQIMNFSGKFVDNTHPEDMF